MSEQRMDQLLESGAKRYSDRAAVIFPDHRMTYADLWERATAVASALASIGVRPGDKIGTLMHNYPEMLEIIFGASKLGAVLVPFNPRYRADELTYVVEHSDVKVVFTTDRAREHTDLTGLLSGMVGSWDREGKRAIRGPFPALERVVCVSDADRDDVLTFESFIEQGKGTPVDHRGSAEEVFSIMYTSGTTAKPKGVLLNHRAFVQRNILVARERMLLEDGESIFGPLPLYHFAAYIPLVLALCVGGRWVTMTHFEAEQASALLERERCTAGWPAFETMLGQQLEEPLVSKYDLSSLEVAALIGPPGVVRGLEERLPNCRLLMIYGGTEMAGVVSLPKRTDSLEARIDTAGPPMPDVEVRIVDDVGRILPPGRAGEICARGPACSTGYYKQPELTRQAFDADGWYHSGDLGLIDEEGRVVYKGRLKDLIKVGGENVTASEVEAFLLTHPKVKAVQVVGVPDRRHSEVPAAFVELREDARCDEAELLAYCEGRLARFKVPRYVRFVTDWPMSTTKVQKHRLSEMLIAELGLER